LFSDFNCFKYFDLFDKIKPNNQITIGYKKLTALPKNGGAKVFEGASDKQVMAYSIVHLSVVPPFTLLEDKSLKVNLFTLYMFPIWDKLLICLIKLSQTIRLQLAIKN
jgi:hypothetical protein